MENTNNAIVLSEEIAQVSDISRIASAMNGKSVAFLTSIPDDGSRDNRIKIYNAVNKSGEKIDDHKGEVLNITNFAAHKVELADDDGVIIEALRIVLIAEDGTCYESVSKGVMSSLEKIFSIVGVAPWTPALPIIPKEVKTRKGYKVLTLELA